MSAQWQARPQAMALPRPSHGPAQTGAGASDRGYFTGQILQLPDFIQVGQYGQKIVHVLTWCGYERTPAPGI